LSPLITAIITEKQQGAFKKLIFVLYSALITSIGTYGSGIMASLKGTD
jgi:hypothetical protein